MKHLKFIFAFLILFYSGFSTAGVWVEPGIGYAKATAEQDVTTVKEEFDMNHLLIGLKFGYSTMGLGVGLFHDRSLSNFELEQTAPTGVTKDQSEWSTKHTGIFVSYKLPILLRVFATYSFHSKMSIQEDENNNGVNEKDDYYKGSAFSVGASYTGLPFLFLNFEYRMATFDEFYDQSSGATTTYPNGTGTSTTEEFKTSAIVFSVSAPFDL